MEGASERAHEVLRRRLVDNLRYEAHALKPAGLRLLIEPIKSFYAPSFYRNRTAQAPAILDDVRAGILDDEARDLPKAVTRCLGMRAEVVDTAPAGDAGSHEQQRHERETPMCIRFVHHWRSVSR